MFRGSVKSTGYPLHSPLSPTLPLPCVTVCRHFSTGVYILSTFRDNLSSPKWSVGPRKSRRIILLEDGAERLSRHVSKISTDQCCVKTPEVRISQKTRYYFVCVVEVSQLLCLQTTFETRHTAPQMLYVRSTRFSEYLY